MKALIASDFAGFWALSRHIDDRVLGQTGHLRGQAILSNGGFDQLDYHETGVLQLGDAPAMEASRRYRWIFSDLTVEVLFEDGRPFHRFTPKGQVQGSDHPCGADFYRVHYDFSKWPAWRSIWTVTGPRKEYTSTSDYVPA